MLAGLVAARGMHDNVCRERSSSAGSSDEALEKHHLRDQKTGRLLAVAVGKLTAAAACSSYSRPPESRGKVSISRNMGVVREAGPWRQDECRPIFMAALGYSAVVMTFSGCMACMHERLENWRAVIGGCGGSPTEEMDEVEC